MNKELESDFKIGNLYKNKICSSLTIFGNFNDTRHDLDSGAIFMLLTLPYYDNNLELYVWQILYLDKICKIRLSLKYNFFKCFSEIKL